MHNRRPLDDNYELMDNLEDYIKHVDRNGEGLSKWTEEKGSTERTEQQREDEVTTLEMDARDLEGLSELLQTLGGSEDKKISSR